MNADPRIDALACLIVIVDNAGGDCRYPPTFRVRNSPFA
jgi:hypothetical protein